MLDVFPTTIRMSAIGEALSSWTRLLPRKLAPPLTMSFRDQVHDRMILGVAMEVRGIPGETQKQRRAEPGAPTISTTTNGRRPRSLCSFGIAP